MRSTRQKLKLIRGISRTNANGGNGLTSRKSSSGNQTTYQQHSNQTYENTSATNGSINGQQTKHHSTTLIHQENQLYSSPSGIGGGRQRLHQKSQGAVVRAGAIRTHSSTSLSSASSTSSLSTSSRSRSPTEPLGSSITEKTNIDKNNPNSSDNNNLLLDNGACVSPLISGTSVGTGHPHRQWTQFLAVNMDCTGPNSDIRAKAFGICRDYLHGAWKQIDSKDLIIKRVSGGLSNWLYHCSLPLSLTPQHNEPLQVLLRFYGQVHGEGALESLITESVIFTLLSERKLGPRLYGVFPGGRVEEFIPARPLLTVELRDTELSLLIAQKTAQIHGLNIPISKEPSWLWGTMDRWMANVRECLANPSSVTDCSRETLQTLIDFNLDAELTWLKQFLPAVNSPVVFAHNDLQEGNILIRPEWETPDEKLVLIDFEYCSYNYRGFDLANHFGEWSYNYNVEAYPNFSFTPQDLPSRAEKLTFIRRYIAVLREEYKVNFADVDDEFLRTSTLFDEEHIIKEAEAFALASHFFWSLWAIVNAQVSKIPFGYWEYGLCRLESFFELKKTFV
ncbi:Choline/ethanolamine kinase [Orchesella cincta]|uniref:Choline/ethanolamine kinase n=1 Tax=Orchesella cincta TaxID=48709 RepID=A0A1D2NHB8_ORCCI|nr:Choline/ethanolamine kinase [Orchesella cincta]